MKDINNTKPGINPSAHLHLLNQSEMSIINKLTHKLWYVTNVQNMQLGQSNYKIVLLKPTDIITQNFNLYREVVAIFSPYDKFEPRALDTLDELDIQELRLEEICVFVISKDNNVASTISTILATNKESRVIVPFTYNELIQDNFDEYFIGQMRRYFYSRDLFGLQDPLKKDIYFFGRNDLVQELVNKHKAGENSGIFGLRKTGKTSILYSVMRTLKRKETIPVMIDCQTLHNKSWNLALRSITQEIIKSANLKKHLLDSNFDKYENHSYASDAFSQDINIILSNLKSTSVLLIFDEIENISYQTSISDGWKRGDDFVKFWQVIRSTYQLLKQSARFSFLIAGTNPGCVEYPSIGDTDNPIFQQFSPIYIEPFSYDQTYEMISRLGGYMGVLFTKEACTHLQEDFGGHPLLMRQLCSFIHRNLNNSRPCIIDTPEYEEFKLKFYKDQTGFEKYAAMVLEVLQKWYSDEYYMLTLLANGDYNTFKDYSEIDSSSIKHLKSYGVIAQDQTTNGYHFKIEAVKDYLKKKNKYKSLELDQDGKRREINERRTNIEIKLRKLIKNTLLSAVGESEAKNILIKEIYGGRNILSKSSIPYKDFFDPNKHNIYLNTLKSIISNNYNLFDKIFGINKESFNAKFYILNENRKPDAHAADISDANFTSFRGVAEWFESILENYD